MPIELPDLDDIDYDALISDAIAALPGYGSDWTDYNPSDPGITMLEMLAWLTEMLVYRTNRIQASSYQAFLQLLGGYEQGALHGDDADRPADAAQAAHRGRRGNEPQQAVREMLQRLHRRYRAVTVADYEQLALDTFPGQQKAGERIRRLTCWPGVDVTHVDPGTGRPVPADLDGAISLVVLPEHVSDTWPQPSDELLDELGRFFEPRRLATTRVRTAGPRYVELAVAATVYIAPDASPREALLEAQRTLFEHLHPVHGGADHHGWPFGCAVHAADLTARLAELACIAFVEDVHVDRAVHGDDPAARLAVEGDRANAGDSVVLAADQLPKLPRRNIILTPKVLSGSLGQKGGSWDDWDYWSPGERSA